MPSAEQGSHRQNYRGAHVESGQPEPAWVHKKAQTSNEKAENVVNPPRIPEVKKTIEYGPCVFIVTTGVSLD